MKTAINKALPLLSGLVLMMAGGGLQSTLLGVRATQGGFDTLTTGVIMSLYYAGTLAGALMAPGLVRRVGHTRVFAAVAALESCLMLVHGLFVVPWVWALVRASSGFCSALFFIVVESWLNDLSTNRIRGRIMGLYLLLLYAAMAAGQFMMTLPDPAGMTLFAAAAILMALSSVPVMLSNRPAPVFAVCERAGIAALFKQSPFGVMTIFLSGIACGAMFSFGAVYAAQSGFGIPAIAGFMAAFLLGGAAFPVPLGGISDRFPRRDVIVAVSFLTAALALLCSVLTGAGLYYALLAAVFVYGGLNLSFYGLGAAYINDRLDPSQFVAASSTMILVNGAGSFFGPLCVAGLMKIAGPGAFFPALCVLFMALFLGAVFRQAQDSRALPDEVL